MKILTCVKALPTAARVGLENDALEPRLPAQVGEYDLVAIEAAVRIKEARPGVEVWAAAVGPAAMAQAALRKALGLGVDRAVAIDDPEGLSAEGIRVASLLAAWARDRGFDLILAGVISEDLERGEVGPMLAELLDLPCATTVVGLELSGAGDVIRCERELEGGERELVELTLPALITVQSGLNVPRYGSLSNVLRARRAEIQAIPSRSLPAPLEATVAVKTQPAARTSRCEFIAGDLETMAVSLLEKIRARSPVLR